MKDKYGNYTPPSIHHPTGSEYDAEYEINERKRTREVLFEYLDCHPHSDDPDVAEHLANAKQAFNDRDSSHLAHCIIAACRLAATSMAIQDTNEWANQRANESLEQNELKMRGLS